jgi:hypothetical protein
MKGDAQDIAPVGGRTVEKLPLRSLTVPFTSDESLAFSSAMLAYSIFSPVRLSTTRPRTPAFCACTELKVES